MTMPAGTYYIGDLCYVLKHKWDEMMCFFYPGIKMVEGEFVLKDGTRFAIYSTKYGDGAYPVLGTVKDVCVDSGTVGCVLVSDLLPNADLEAGYIHEFENSFKTDSYQGAIEFGYVTVETGIVEDGDYEDDWVIEPDWGDNE